MAKPQHPDDTAVFLNVPFDRAYEPLFVALVAALTALGRTPRCVLEIPDHGQGRLNRIMEHLESCAVSIHDLSRVGMPARFNMPFELGLAYAIRTLSMPQSPYRFVLLEKIPHRLNRTLSDMAAHDPGIHQGKPLGMISCVLDALGTGKLGPAAEEVHDMWRTLMKAARRLKDAEGKDTIYSAALFKRLAAAATELAVRADFIPA
jgi:hypothetical protein